MTKIVTFPRGSPLSDLKLHYVFSVSSKMVLLSAKWCKECNNLCLKFSG